MAKRKAKEVEDDTGLSARRRSSRHKTSETVDVDIRKSPAVSPTKAKKTAAEPITSIPKSKSDQKVKQKTPEVRTCPHAHI